MRKIFILSDKNQQNTTATKWGEELSKIFNHEVRNIYYQDTESADDFAKYLEESDASFLLMELNKRKDIQRNLNLCRGLRMPYMFIPKGLGFDATNISMPVTFLIEDKEKITFASAFGRFANSNILIYKPRDYGSKAITTINQGKTLFDKFSLSYQEIDATGDSYKIEKEAVGKAISDKCHIVILSASREYGLDDIIFGSKEKKILKKTEVAIMLINPRGDLYTLCD